MTILRPYQHDVIGDFRRAVEAGYRRILLVAPTGSGKTVIGAEIVREIIQGFRPALVVAHRREIIDQTSKKLRGIPHGIIQPGRTPRPLERVQVASVQTLHRRAIRCGTMGLPGRSGPGRRGPPLPRADLPRDQRRLSGRDPARAHRHTMPRRRARFGKYLRCDRRGPASCGAD